MKPSLNTNLKIYLLDMIMPFILSNLIFIWGYSECRVGVPTLKRISSDLAGWFVFRTIFHKAFKTVTFIKIRQCPLTRKLCFACLLNFAEQASWTELARHGGLSDQKLRRVLMLRIEKLRFWESPIKICDWVGTHIKSMNASFEW